MLLESGKVVNVPLAGTRSRKGTDIEIESKRQELQKDSKEIVEHIFSIKGAMKELDGLCQKNSAVVEDLMSVREQCSLQHLGSRVFGILSPQKDG